MEFKYKDINLLTGILSRMISGRQKLPIKGAQLAHKMIKIVNTELETHQKLYSEIINEYATKDENGELIKEMKIIDGKEVETGGVIVEDTVGCAEKIRELEELTFETGLNPVSIDDLGKMEISIAEFEALEGKLFY